LFSKHLAAAPPVAMQENRKQEKSSETPASAPAALVAMQENQHEKEDPGTSSISGCGAGNPKCHSTYVDQSFNATISKLAKTMHPNHFAERVLAKYILSREISRGM